MPDTKKPKKSLKPKSSHSSNNPSNKQHNNDPPLTTNAMQDYYDNSVLNGVANSYIMQNYFPKTSLDQTSPPCNPSPISGNTYFVAAKEEVYTMLGGNFDYTQKYKELSNMLDLKDHLSQSWSQPDEPQRMDLYTSNEKEKVGYTMPSISKLRAPANNIIKKEQPSSSKKLSHKSPSSLESPAHQSNDWDTSKYEEWDVSNLPLSFKVAFWRTHHPGQAIPQYLKPKNPQYHDTDKLQPHQSQQSTIPPQVSRQNQHTLQQPSLKKQVYVPAMAPTIPIISVVESPPLFSHNVAIQRTNVKPSELHKVQANVIPPDLLEAQVPKPKQNAITQTISNAFTQTSPAIKISKNDPVDFSAQTINSSETQTISTSGTQTTTTSATQTKSTSEAQTTIKPTTKATSSQATTVTHPNLTNSSIQTTPVMESISIQTQPEMHGAVTDTTDLPRSPKFILQADTVVPSRTSSPTPVTPSIKPTLLQHDVPLPSSDAMDAAADLLQQEQERHRYLSRANHLEKRVLQMLCDKILSQMITEHQEPVEMKSEPAVPTPPPPPPAPPQESDDSLLRFMIGHAIAEDIINNLKPVPLPVNQEPKPVDKHSLKSFFLLSDSGILSHHVEPPILAPAPPPPPSPPTPSPPTPEPQVIPPPRVSESKAIQTSQSTDVGTQMLTHATSIAIQANEPVTVGVQTAQDAAIQVQCEDKVLTTEAATQPTPPPSPPPPPKPVAKPKLIDLSFKSTDSESFDFSDGEMKDIISDGEMVQRNYTGNKFLPPLENQSTYFTDLSDGELSEGEASFNGLQPQFSDGEIVFGAQGSDGEIVYHTNQSIASDGELLSQNDFLWSDGEL